MLDAGSGAGCALPGNQVQQDALGQIQGPGGQDGSFLQMGQVHQQRIDLVCQVPQGNFGPFLCLLGTGDNSLGGFPKHIQNVGR